MPDAATSRAALWTEALLHLRGGGLDRSAGREEGWRQPPSRWSRSSLWRSNWRPKRMRCHLVHNQA